MGPPAETLLLGQGSPGTAALSLMRPAGLVVCLTVYSFSCQPASQPVRAGARDLGGLRERHGESACLGSWRWRSRQWRLVFEASLVAGGQIILIMAGSRGKMDSLVGPCIAVTIAMRAQRHAVPACLA